MRDFRNRVRGGVHDLRRESKSVKTKNATKKKKVKDEFFPRSTTFNLAIFSFVAICIVTLFPSQVKGAQQYLKDLNKGVTTITQVDAINAMEMLNPVVEPESNLNPKIIPVVLHEPSPTPQAEKSVAVSFPKNQQDNSFSDYIKASKYGPIIYRQWILESSMGTKGHAVQCRMQNQFNDFGLAVPTSKGGDTSRCFSSFEYSVDRMVAWWDKWGADDLNKKLCIYNKGPNSVEAKSGECDYSLNFWRL